MLTDWSVNSNINRLAYLNSLNKKPQQILLELIQLESFVYTFEECSSRTSSNENIRDIIFTKYKLDINQAILNRLISNNFKLLDKKLVSKNTVSLSEFENFVSSTINSENEFLDKVANVRKKFIDFTKDNYNKKISDEEAKKIFSQYIYSATIEQDIDDDSSGLYFIFKKFLLNCLDNDIDSLGIIEDFGIANQIQYLVIDDFENDSKFLEGCTIFVDTPILIKRLGYDGLSFWNDYKEIFNQICNAGATLKIFAHTFDELWGILFNFKKCIAQNILDAKGVATFLKARQDFAATISKEKPNYEVDDILTLDKERLITNIINLKIEIIDDIQEEDLNENNYKKWEFDSEKFKTILLNCSSNLENYPLRVDRDVQSISSITRLRKAIEIDNRSKKFKDYKYFLLVDNYMLVKAINEYHKDADEKWGCNELLLENSLLFSLWQNLSDNANINKTLFRSKCFAMNVINGEFKDRLYRETRRLEIYSQLPVKDSIIASPDIIDNVYDKSIKDNNNIDKAYIASTIKNEIEKKQKELENKVDEQNLLIAQQCQTIANHGYEINEIKIDTRKEIENLEDEITKADIENLAKYLLKSPINKMKIFLKKIYYILIKKEFDADGYLFEKARSILSK